VSANKNSEERMLSCSDEVISGENPKKQLRCTSLLPLPISSSERKFQEEKKRKSRKINKS
jgi:hypothetical protein